MINLWLSVQSVDMKKQGVICMKNAMVGVFALTVKTNLKGRNL